MPETEVRWLRFCLDSSRKIDHRVRQSGSHRGRDRREFVADWLTSRENPYFTRAIVNRVWAAFFGIGIVNPVDDLRLSNPASNEMLMKGLCDYLVGERYNLKSLMRLILNSDAYQRSSETTKENKDDQRYFSHYYPRRLSAEILSDAISSVTGIPEQFDAIALQDGSSEKTALYPRGFRAVQVYDAAVRSYFLKTFGRNQREITCDCERSNQPSMVQALHLSNGTTINDKPLRTGSREIWMTKSLLKPPSSLVSQGHQHNQRLLDIQRFSAKQNPTRGVPAWRT